MLSEHYFLEGNRIHFFAFNIDDVPDLDQFVKIEGVPSIMLVKTRFGRSEIFMMPEPPPGEQHPKNWYHFEDINKFIGKHVTK